jgi:hypothetical protein
MDMGLLLADFTTGFSFSISYFSFPVQGDSPTISLTGEKVREG